MAGAHHGLQIVLTGGLSDVLQPIRQWCYSTSSNVSSADSRLADRRRRGGGRVGRGPCSRQRKRTVLGAPSIRRVHSRAQCDDPDSDRGREALPVTAATRGDTPGGPDLLQAGDKAFRQELGGRVGREQQRIQAAGHAAPEPFAAPEPVAASIAVAW